MLLPGYTLHSLLRSAQQGLCFWWELNSEITGLLKWRTEICLTAVCSKSAFYNNNMSHSPPWNWQHNELPTISILLGTPVITIPNTSNNYLGVAKSHFPEYSVLFCCHKGHCLLKACVDFFFTQFAWSFPSFTHLYVMFWSITAL